MVLASATCLANGDLGLDYRRFNLDGSFDDFNINNADIGGDLFLEGLRFSFLS